ncbi:MAG: hypothetical protein O7E52_07270 [Candidatus Poribacteria bacterium]|nr:hypothetical protein [Candidatus Poribacteria bacterium]
MKLGFLSKLFEGVLSIEKTYNDCDKAISRLGAYNERIAEMRENNEDVDSFPADEKAELDKIVDRAVEGATRLVKMEPGRDWPGVFREMHKNLANIYFELHEYDKVREECETLHSYGKVGQQDAEEVLQKLSDKENNKVDSLEEAQSAV